MTGQPRREFFALRPELARYRVCKCGAHFEVSGTDGPSEGAASMRLSAAELATSPIGKAITDGRLFCEALERSRSC